ncbi:MAG: peptide ABC transporter substrate-binding protein [Verrucomicrobiales bacterium]|nr:peptide ABC transporter substrate-binding protein [Verrucomicrobiales bacterium]
MLRPLLSRLLVFFLLAILLTGCGRRERKVDRATKDGILLLGNGAEPKALDPHLVSSVGDSNILRAMFEGLVTYHPSDDSKNEPGVAERWESNPDATEWTFYLRKDAKWSNGDPVTAHDFVYSFGRLLHPEMGGPYTSMLYILKNAAKYNKGEIKSMDQVGVRAEGDHLLHCTLENPAPFFPDVVKHTTFLPVHKATIEKYGSMTDHFTKWQVPGNSVSNGAFKLTKWRINGYVQVDKNPHYWDAENVKLNAIRFFPMDNAFTEERAFRNGLLHVTYVTPSSLIGRYRKMENTPLRAETYSGTYFYRFNTTRELSGNIHFRRALSAAIDRQRIVEFVTAGGQQPAYGFTPPSEGGYQPPDRVAFDPEAAREHLRKAGFESGADVPKFVLFINTSESHKDIAVAIQDMWKTHLGIDGIEIQNQEWKVYQKTIQDLNYDVARAGWIGDYVDPDTFLSLFTTNNTNNSTGWSNPDYDRKMVEASRLFKVEERYAKLQEAEDILLDELPITPLYWYTSVYLIDPGVKNWHPLLLNNHPYKHIELRAN